MRFLLAASVLALLASVPVTPTRAAEPTFDSLDKHHDGVLSKDEVATLFPAPSTSDGNQRRQGQGMSPGGRGGGFGGGLGGSFGGHGGGGMMHGGGGSSQSGTQHSSRKAPNADEIFKSWDKDGNGTISREEFDSRPRTSSRKGGEQHNVDPAHAPPQL
jgi:hypothetical protein